MQQLGTAAYFHYGASAFTNINKFAAFRVDCGFESIDTRAYSSSVVVCSAINNRLSNIFVLSKMETRMHSDYYGIGLPELLQRLWVY